MAHIGRWKNSLPGSGYGSFCLKTVCPSSRKLCELVAAKLANTSTVQQRSHLHETGTYFSRRRLFRWLSGLAVHRRISSFDVCRKIIQRCYFVVRRLWDSGSTGTVGSRTKAASIGRDVLGRRATASARPRRCPDARTLGRSDARTVGWTREHAVDHRWRNARVDHHLLRRGVADQR